MPTPVSRANPIPFGSTLSRVPDASGRLDDAINTGNEKAVLAFLDLCKLLPRQLDAMLERVYASKRPCPFHIKEALLNHHAATPNLQHALTLAVEHDDTEFAVSILRKGGAPEAHHLQRAGHAMRLRLNYARRLRLLYPTNCNPADEYVLDRLLKDFRIDDALALLKREGCTDRPSDNRRLWADAIRHERYDILRAFLLLGIAEKDREFRLKEDPAFNIKDAALKAVMKEVPYLSPKRKVRLNLNGDAVNAAGENVMCRHLVEHRQRTQAASPRIKSSYADVESVDAISARVNIEEVEMMNMKHLATELHLVDNQAGFGSFLVRQFEAMLGKREASRQILMESTNHAMSLELLIKDDGGEKFVVRFYDPNDTLTHVRCVYRDVESIAALRMDAILPSDTIENYYPEARGFSIMFVRPSEDILQAHLGVTVPSSDSRQLASGLDGLEINGTVIFLLLQAGVTEELLSSKVKDAISNASAAEKIKLLGTRDEEGCSGLFIAMQEGYGSVVAALSELLSLLGNEVSCKDLATLIEAIDHSGNSALWVAMRYNQPDAVREYRKLLQHIEDDIPEQILASLLEAKGENGASGLYSALQMGHGEVIRVYSALLEAIRRKVPQTALTRLIDARKDGCPGLYAALLNGHADAIREYGRLLKDLPMNHWIGLVRVTASALRMAMKDSHVDAMQAFIEICNERLDQMSASQRKDLLTAIRKSHVANDARGLFDNINYYNKFKITDPEFCDQLEDLERRLEKGSGRSGRITNKQRGVQ
jgi:hypothetical protein